MGNMRGEIVQTGRWSKFEVIGTRSRAEKEVLGEKVGMRSEG